MKRIPKKQIMLFVSFLLMAPLIVGLSGCSSKEESIAKTQEEKQILKVTTSFIDKIEHNDYKGIVNNIFLPEESYVTDADVKWFMPRSNFSKLVNKSIQIQVTGFEETSPPYEVSDMEETIKAQNAAVVDEDDNEYIFPCVINDKNQWRVYLENFLAEQWELVVDKTAIVDVNGVELTKNNIEDTAYSGDEFAEGQYVVYRLHNVPKKKIPVTITVGGNTKTVQVMVNGGEQAVVK